MRTTRRTNDLRTLPHCSPFVSLGAAFFQAGGVEGPFPGSRSEQGMVAAGAYWQGNRPGKYMTMSVPSHFMPDGRKYKTSYM